MRLVVDCAAGAPARLPEAADTVAIVAGIAIPRLVSPADEGIAERVQWRLNGLCDAGMTHL